MHGFKPEDIKHLVPLRGQTIIQVAVGEFQLQFGVGPRRAGGFSVEGRCELITPAGDVLDSWDRGKRSREFRLLDALGKTITDVVIDTDKSFVAVLSDGSRLRVIDNSDKYESFSVGRLFV